MLPLEQHTLVNTQQVEHARQLVSDVYCDHKLVPLSKDQEQGFHARHNNVPLKSLSFNYMSYAAKVLINPGFLENFYLLQKPINSGTAVINTGSREFISHSKTSSLINPSLKTSMVWNEGCEHLMVQINRSALEQELSRLSHCDITTPIEFEPEIDLGKHRRMESWWRMVQFLVDDIDSGSFGCLSEAEQCNLETTLIVNLLHALPHNYSALLEAGAQHIAPRHVKKSEAYMLEHLHQPINIGDLVDVTDVSARTLFESFKRFRGVTPMKRLMQFRLERAHQDLSSAREGDTVTDILTRNGITQLGRFAAQYRQAFGESPSDTLKKR